MAGNYYIYDSIAPVADLLASQLGYTDTQIGWLYSIYSVSAITTLLLGGILVDRFGVRVAGLAFAVVCLAGALINVASGSYAAMLAGPLRARPRRRIAHRRRHDGAGEVVQGQGTGLRVRREPAGGAPRVGRRRQLADVGAGALRHVARPARRIAVVAGVIGVVGAAVYWVLEARADRVYSLGAAGEADKLVVADLFKFTRSYWFIVGLCLVFYSAVFPFRTFAVKFFMEGHGATRELGGFLNSVLPLSAMVATPLFGLLVDRVGRRALFMLAGSVLLVPAFVLLVPGLGLTPSLYVPIALLGIAFSLIPAVMWPSVTYVVEQNRLGTAYALMTLVQQVGVMAMNWGIGAANDAAGAERSEPRRLRAGDVAVVDAGRRGRRVRAAAAARRDGPGRARARDDHHPPPGVTAASLHDVQRRPEHIALADTTGGLARDRDPH